MSDKYPRSIRSEENGRRGCVFVDELKIDLHLLPQPPRFLRSLFALFYAPPLQMEVMETCRESRRPMRKEEVEQAENFLNGLQRAERTYLGAE